MEKYVGVCCPVCNNRFVEEDDIVVCPQCGAPHHRECYKKLGRCAFTEQHAQGNDWKNPNDIQPVSSAQGLAVAKAAYMHPPAEPKTPSLPDYSKLFNPTEETKEAQAKKQAAHASAFGINLDDELEGVPIKDIAQFVGQNSMYYLVRFKILASKQPFFNLNFSAMLTGFFFFFYRKMYKVGAALLAVFIITCVPQLILTYLMFPEMFAYITIDGMAPPVIPYTGLLMLTNIFSYVHFIVLFVSAAFANKLYYKHTLKEVNKIKNEFRGRSDSDCTQALTLRGRTNKIIIIAIIVALVVIFNFYCGFILASYPII